MSWYCWGPGEHHDVLYQSLLLIVIALLSTHNLLYQVSQLNLHHFHKQQYYP